jgi:DNA polymerase III subunit alpha
MTKKTDFVHLHTHSHYSLLDGLSKIPDLVDKAKEYGMTALGLTDHGSMYGAIEFYKACRAANIKPIIGVEAYVALRSRIDKEPGIDDKRYHLTLLSRNVEGYKNLLKLVSRAALEGFYYKPRIDDELLREHSEGLICLTGCPSGKLTQLLRRGSREEAKKLLLFYIEIFGKEHVFVEIMKHDEVDWYLPLIPEIISLAKEVGLPLVATWDSHYISKDDKEAHNTLLHINTNNKSFTLDGDYSFISPDIAETIYKDIPEALLNTKKVADLVDLELDLGTWTFPRFDLPNNKTADQVLKELAYEGFAQRNLPRTDEYIKRLEYELEIIKNKGFSIYLLIVADLLRFARENDIFSTIRGSVAGSLTTYLTGVTRVNPIEYKLPFERFLNPERPSAPDIDMDYADNRRDEVIAYAREKYGEEKVAQIGTFGTMAARGSVRDVARALGYPYTTGDKIAKLIPIGSQGFPMTIDRAIEMEPELKKMYSEDTEVQEIIDLARRIEGSARHISVHAAGVVISPTAVTDYVPVQIDPKAGKTITQYDMHAVEDAGLIKFDFLGLKNLAILSNVIKIVRRTQNIDVDIENIPLDDKKTFKMLALGETSGLFQLNGSGMTRFLKDLKPSSILDVNAMVALYRPGPMETIPSYIERKHNPSLITYLDPRMEEILDQSFGVITYQDDVLMIAIKLAGYSWLEADKLRKAMGKKIPAEMEAQKTKLLDGLVEHGLSKENALKLWALIEPFAAYGFNKAHAASYGRVAYQTAYMKANFPVEYMAAVLTADSGDVEKIAEIITECKRMKISVLQPDINESFADFTVVEEENENKNSEQKIRFGLTSIKNFGRGITDAVVAQRKKNGPFTSLSDFLSRVQDRNINRKSLEALIKSGAFDSLEDRAVSLKNIDLLLAYAKEARVEANQDSLFSLLATTVHEELKLEPAEPIADKIRLAWEKELLGLYVSGHPLEEFRHELEFRDSTITDIREKAQNNSSVTLCGIVEEVKEILTKKGEKMAFVKIADFGGSLELVVFPDTLKNLAAFFKPELCICVSGKFSVRNGDPSILVEKARLLKQKTIKDTSMDEKTIL